MDQVSSFLSDAVHLLSQVIFTIGNIFVIYVSDHYVWGIQVTFSVASDILIMSNYMMLISTNKLNAALNIQLFIYMRD